MGINEMDLNWRLNWWYRPIQCDGTETSVTDYYESFCDWKDTMEIHGCPAGETDYVDAFIQGLKPDIRLRLESKGKTSTRRLGVAFYDAKLEESLISIDEAFKKIKAKFEAHKPFDKMSDQFNSEKEKGLVVVASYIDESPIDKRAKGIVGPQPIQGEHMSVKVYFDQFCIWISKLEAVNYIGDEESHVDEFFYGLRKDLRERVLQSKWKTSRLSDALRRAEIYETFLSWEKDYGHNDANDMFEDMPNPESEHSDELQKVEVVSNEKIDEIVVQIDEDSGKIVSPNADDKVLDELPKPAFTMTAAYVLIDEKSELNSHTGAPPNRVLDYSEHDALNMLNTSTGLLLTGLNSSPEKLIPVEFVMVKNAYQMFDKMLQLTLVWPYDELNGNNGSIPLIDCVPKVFDPGDGVETVPPFGWRIDETSKTFSIQIVSVSACFPIFDKMPSQISLEQTRGNDGEVIMTVFDPGGIISQDANNYSAFPNIGKIDSEGFDIHTTAHTSYSSQLDIEIVSEWEANSSNNQFELTSLSEVAWTICWDCLQHCVGGYLLKLSTILMMIMLSIDFSYDHCCKRMWHEKIFRSLIYIDHCLLIAVYNLIWRPCHGKTINCITSVGKYVSADGGTKPTEHPLQELLGQQKEVGYIPWSYDRQTQGQFSELCRQNSLRSVAFALGNGKNQCQSVDEFPLLSQVYKITKHRDSVTTAAFRLSMEKGSWELYISVRGNFCVGMFAVSCLFLEGRFPVGHKNVVRLMIPFAANMVITLERFVWDPGLGANNFFFSLSHALRWCHLGEHSVLYILGDKDGFEGEGKRMIYMRIGDGIQESMQSEYGIMELSRSDEDSRCQLETKLKEELIDCGLRPRKLSPSHPIVIADFSNVDFLCFHFLLRVDRCLSIFLYP